MPQCSPNDTLNRKKHPPKTVSAQYSPTSANTLTRNLH